MAEYYTTLTNIGADKVAAAMSGGPALHLAQMAAGDGGGASFYNQYDRDALKQRTHLVNQRWADDLNLVDQDPQNPAWVVTEGLIPTHVGGWYIREVGVFDIEGDLIAIGVYPETYKPVATAVEADLLIRSILEVGDAATVELKIDPSQVMATRAWVLESAIPQALTILDDAVERAEVARDIAQLAVGIFTTEQAGIDATDADNFFWVALQNEEHLVALYKNEGGVADFYGKYPSGKAFELLNERLSYAFDLASQPTDLGGEFHTDDSSQPLHIIIGETGHGYSGVDQDGYQFNASRTEFHSIESEIAYCITDANGNSLLAIGSDGRQISYWLSEFHIDESTIAYAYIDELGSLLSAWNKSGLQISETKKNENEYQLIPYITNNQLRAADSDDHLISEINSDLILSTYPRCEKTVSAVLSAPYLSDTMLVAGGIKTGYIVPSSKKIMHVVVGIGQSLMSGGRSQTTLISVDPVYPKKALMLESGIDSDVRMRPAIENGALNVEQLTGFTPLVAAATGIEGETPLEAAVNSIISCISDTLDSEIPAPYLAINAGLSGTPYSGLKKGTEPYQNMLLALEKAKALAEEEGFSIIVDACLHKHGEGDGTSETYYDDLIEWQNDIDADFKQITGQKKDVPFIMAQPSGWSIITPSAVLAMLKAHEDSPNHWLSGSDYPYSEFYDMDRDDFTHFTGPGYVMIGEKMSHAFRDLLFKSQPSWDVVRIKSAVRVGSTVTLTYSCPSPPLVFDTTTISERDVKGYRYIVDGVDLLITSAVIVSDGTSSDATVQLNLSSIPEGEDEKVVYALTRHDSPRTSESQPRGNIRDSFEMASSYDSRPLYNWGVHQSIAVSIS